MGTAVTRDRTTAATAGETLRVSSNAGHRTCNDHRQSDYELTTDELAHDRRRIAFGAVAAAI
jgi:hypothetical protein